MSNNTYSNKYRTKQVYEIGIQYLDGNVIRIKTDKDKNDTVYFKENKDNLYVSVRRPLDDGTTVTKHTKVFKNAIAAFYYTELPYTKKEIENGED